MSGAGSPRRDQSGGASSAADAATNIIGHVQTLVRQEVALVKAQLSDAAGHFGKAAGAGGAAAVMALYMLGFFGVAGAIALQMVVWDWLAWLIVGAVFLVLTLVAGLIARSQATKGSEAPSVATDKIKEDVAWAKQQIKP